MILSIKKSPPPKDCAVLRVISHLNVSSVHSSDGGLYRCQAENTVRHFFSVEQSQRSDFFETHNFGWTVQICPTRWVWWLTPQGSMCTVRHPRGASTMSLLFPGSFFSRRPISTWTYSNLYPPSILSVQARRAAHLPGVWLSPWKGWVATWNVNIKYDLLNITMIPWRLSGDLGPDCLLDLARFLSATGRCSFRSKKKTVEVNLRSKQGQTNTDSPKPKHGSIGRLLQTSLRSCLDTLHHSC